MIDDSQKALLRDMLDSALAIRAYTEGISRDAFLANTEKQDAVLRRFEIIGEAASRVSDATKEQLPQIPFRSIRGMRNIIAHDYGAVDVNLVWNTVVTELDDLVAQLSAEFEP